MTLFIKRSAVKEGMNAIGERLVVAWAPLAFELAAPAQPQNKQATPQHNCVILKNLDDLKDDLQDTILGVEARVFVRLHSLEEKVTVLQCEVVEKCASPLLDYSAFPPLVDHSAFIRTTPLRTLPSESVTHSTPYLPEADHNSFPNSTNTALPTPMWSAPQEKTSM